LPVAKGINKVAKKIYKLGKKEITKAELLTLFIFKHIKHNISIIEIVVC
jgi:ribosomal protein S3AE